MRLLPWQSRTDREIRNGLLYKNSFLLLLNSALSAALGFLFWLVATKYYTTQEVGSGSAVISSMSIVVSISSLGLGTMLVRFLPANEHKSTLFNSTLMLTLISSLIVAVLFLALIGIVSPVIASLMKPIFILVFLVGIVLQAGATLANAGLLGQRRADYSFLQSTMMSLRIALLIPLALAGTLGILGSITSAFFASFLIGILLLRQTGIIVRPALSKKCLIDVIPYSFANYVVDALQLLTTASIPILVLNVIGPSTTAYYSIAYSFASFLFAVPLSVFMSLFIEGSHNEPLGSNLKKSVAMVLLMMLPAALVMYVFGDSLLSIFGEEYSRNAFKILKWLVLSSFFVALNAMYGSMKRIQKDMMPLVLMNFLLLGSTVALVYVFSVRSGAIGIGYGWFAGQGVTSILVACLLWRDGGFKNVAKSLNKDSIT